MNDIFAGLAALFERAAVDYAVIGAHAVNAWIEPRATADVDVTVCADAAEQRRLRQVFESAGYVVEREHGAGLPSAPDFVRFVADGRVVTVEVQSAKTELQRSVVARSRPDASGLKIATPEDLVVMKLIAWRPKDRLDLSGLIRLPELDWSYIERWAAVWEVTERLGEIRKAGSD